MGKQERDEFIAKNDLDVLRIKKALFIIIYLGMFIIVLSIVNTLMISLARADSDYYPKTSSLNSYNYTFSTDTLVEINAPITLNSTNNYNETTYELPYNATYTFTGETGGTITGWTEDEVGGTIHYDTLIYGHDYVVHLDDNGGGTPKLYQDFASDQTSGTIEFWMLNGLASTHINTRFYENTYGGTLPFRISIDSDYLQFSDGSSWHLMGGALDNVWYHFSLEFDTIIDEVNVSVNGVRKLSSLSVTDVANIGAIGFLTSYTPAADMYIDAIDYSWDSGYTPFRSLYGVKTDTGVSQTAYWDFWHTEAGEYSSLIHPIPFFTELTPAGSGNVQCENGYFYTTTLYDTDGVNGFYKTFTSDEGFYNITWKDKIGSMYSGHKDAWYGTALYDQSNNLLTEVNITYDDTTDIYCLQYNNGTNFVNLSTGLQDETYYEFNLYTDGNIVILRFNNTDVFSFSTVGYNAGFGKVSFTQAQLDDLDYRIDTKRYTDYVGVYINGTSQSNDMRTINLDLGVSSFKPYSYYYMDVAVGGNYSLTLADDSSSETYIEYGEHTNATQTINIYDFGDVVAPPDTPPPLVYTSYNPFIAFTTNQTLDFVSIKIYSGIILNDGDVDYYSQITYYNLTSDDISFSVVGNSLHYNATFNYTKGQYAQFNFYRDTQEYLDEYVISTTGSVNDTGGLCLLSINYATSNPTNITFSSTTNSYYGYLRTYKYLTNIIIKIYDNPDDNFNRSITGYLNNFTVSYLKYYAPVLPTADNWVSLIIIVMCVFPVPIIIHIRIKKRYPDEKHDMLQYLIPAIIGCVITTALYFGDLTIMPLFVYITLFVGFFLLILPSMLNRYLTLGLMFVSLMVYGGYFPAWVYVINVLIVSFTTIMSVKNMNIGDR